MSETPQKRFPFGPRAILRGIGSLISRTYALVLAVVLGYAGYLAGSYLLDSIYKPAATPGRVLRWQVRTDAAALREPEPPGVLADDARAPVAHFHRVVRLSQPDPQNGCTLAGCHEPIPHTPKLKIAAFANFHVNFMACQSCHTEIKERPAKFTWMNLNAARSVEVPPVIRLVRLLNEKADTIQKQPAAVHPAILALLQEVLKVRVHDRTLEELQVQIENSEPGSPIWRSALKRLAGDLPRYGRGNYGSKLIPESQLKTYGATHEEMVRLAPACLASAAGSPERKTLSDRIHASVLKQPPSCTACHADSPGLLDFTTVGYLPARATMLGNLQIARTIQNVREGREFRLPALTEVLDAK